MTLLIRLATFHLVFNIVISIFFILLGILLFYIVYRTKKRALLKGARVTLVVLGLFFIGYGIFILTLFSHRRFEKIQKSASTLGIVYKLKGLVVPNVSSLKYKMPPVLNQGSLGTCVSNATSNCLKFHMKYNTFQPSRLYLHYNSFINIRKESIKKAATRGIAVEDVLQTLSTYKYCDERLWPYFWWRVWTVPSQKAYKDTNYHPDVTFSTVEQSLGPLKEVLQHEPIIVCFLVYPSLFYFTTFMTGYVPMPEQTEKTTSAHCVLLCGYNDDERLFTIQNSWGIYSGDSGYYYMPYDYILNPDMTWGFFTLQLAS